MGIHRRIALAISCLCLFLSLPGFASPAAAAAAAAASVEILGIAPHDAGYYKGSVIKCKDGLKSFARQQLNDDFCDCTDGTDEPGTSACPEGKFYCLNAGHIPRAIFSSRVNDGICDCCDGSDEYSSNVNCSNTCWEAGKAAREKLKKKIATYQEGLVIRKQEVEKAKQLFATEEEDLSQLKKEEKILQGLVDKLKEHKERIEKAEEEERKKEEKKFKDVEKDATNSKEPPEDPSHNDLEDTQDMSSTLPSHSQVAEDHVDSKSIDMPDEISGEESSSEIEEQSSEETEGLSRDELGRLVASRWTGEHSKEIHSKVDTKEEGHQDNSEVADNSVEENYDGYNSEVDDDRYKYEDNDGDDEDDEQSDDDSDEAYREDDNETYGEDDNASHDDDFYSPDEDPKSDNSEFTPRGSSSWLEKVQLAVQRVLKYLEIFKTPVDISEASNVRKEYNDASSKLSKLQSRISSLTEKLKHNFGKEKEFYGFYGRCFQNKQNKYTYKVCPFKSASQIEGHSTTKLGSWEKLEESYNFMLFSNGDTCWNGPDRSLKVMLRCGLKYELTDVDEPSRCEYKAILSSPIFCSEDRLKELQQKLEDLNPSQPANNNHDEL